MKKDKNGFAVDQDGFAIPHIPFHKNKVAMPLPDIIIADDITITLKGYTAYGTKQFPICHFKIGNNAIVFLERDTYVLHFERGSKASIIPFSYLHVLIDIKQLTTTAKVALMGENSDNFTEDLFNDSD